MKIGDLFVQLGLDVSKFQTNMGLARQSLTGMNVGINALRASALTAFGGTAFAIFGAIAAKAADDEQAVTRLRQAVENTGAVWDNYASHIDKALAAGRAFGFSSGQQREALALLVTQTESVEEGLRRLAVAYDVSRATQQDLYAVSRLLGKVTEENVVGLNRMGIAVRKGATEEEFFEDVLRKVGGQAQAQSKNIRVQADIISNAFREALGNAGKVAKDFAPILAALAIAFEQTGLRGLIATTGVGGFAVALKGLAVSAALATRALAGLLIAMLPLAALAAAGTAVAVGLGKIGQALNIPLLDELGDTFDMLFESINKLGVGGFLGEMAGELFGIGRAAPDTATGLDTASGALNRFSGAYSAMITRLKEGGTFPGSATFKQIEDSMRAFARDVPGLTQSLSLIEDTLAGIRGMGKEDATRTIGASIRSNLVKVVSAEVENMEQLRDSAKREMESVARFWVEETARRADFARTMAERARPVIETIDQLTKDMGEGFDAAKRAAQAQAVQARFNAETAELERREAERRKLVREPEMPTVEKIKEQFGSLEALDARIAEMHTRNAEVFKAFDELVAGVIKSQKDAIAAAEEARLILRHPEIIGEERPSPIHLTDASQVEGTLENILTTRMKEEEDAEAKRVALFNIPTEPRRPVVGAGAPSAEPRRPVEPTPDERPDMDNVIVKRDVSFDIPVEPRRLVVDVNITAPDELFTQIRTERLEAIVRATFDKIVQGAEVIVRQMGGSTQGAPMLVP